MRPGLKISLIYSGITIGLVLVAGLLFFALSSRYTERLYYRYLTEKAETVAMERFEKDELDSVRYQNVVQRRMRSIPTSQEIFINTADQAEADRCLAAYLDAHQRRLLYAGQMVNFTHDDQVGTALLYYDNEGTFAVVVLSRNPYGEQIAHTVGWALLVLVVLSSLVLYLISRLWAARMVNRIDQRYQTERLFVDNASHEINNPLTAIQGECEVALLRERTPEEYRRSLRRIEGEAGRIIAIIRQLLHFSRRPASTEEQTAVRMSDFLRQFIDGQGREADTPHAGTTLEVIHDFTVLADEDLLRMAIGNLVSNARKYGGGKPVVLRIDRPRLEIIDHGLGIPPADLPHIFQPFYRAANASAVRGTGIGLALARQLLKRMGTTLAVQSTEGEGTTFIVRFRV